jgi:tetratricopeptide (TPR) repeat protein
VCALIAVAVCSMTVKAYEFTCQPQDRDESIHCTLNLPTREASHQEHRTTFCADGVCVEGVFRIYKQADSSASKNDSIQSASEPSKEAAGTESGASQGDKAAATNKQASSSQQSTTNSQASMRSAFYWNSQYPKPYTQYPQDVAQVLQNRPPYFINDYELVEWLIQVSFAYKQAMLDEMDKILTLQESTNNKQAIMSSISKQATVNKYLQQTLSPLDQVQKVIQLESERVSSRESEEYDLVLSYQALVAYYRGDSYDAVYDMQKSVESYKQADALYTELLTPPSSKDLDAILEDANSNYNDNHESDAAFYNYIEDTLPWPLFTMHLNWAASRLRVGLHELSQSQSPDVLYANQQVLSTVKTPTQLEDIMQKQNYEMQQQVKLAVEWLEGAVSIFERFGDDLSSDDKDDYDPQEYFDLYISWKRQWAYALGNLSTAWNTLQDLVKATQYGRQSVDMYKATLQEIELDPSARDPDSPIQTHLYDIRQSLADILYTMANLSLQHGTSAKYDEAIAHYKESVDMYKRYNLVMPPLDNPLVQGGEDAFGDSIEDLEQALQEYAELFTDGVTSTETYTSLNEAVSDEPGVVYDKSDVYEGDLHSNLGMLYFAKGDVMLASTHLQRALQLYGMAGEAETQMAADIHLSMATVHLYNENFAESVNSYMTAIDIYRRTVEEGQNPISLKLSAQDLEALQQQQGDGLEEKGNLRESSTNSKTRRRKVDARRGATRKVPVEKPSKDSEDDSVLINLQEWEHAVPNVTSPMKMGEL